MSDSGQEWPLLYYRTREDIEAYAARPVEAKLAWLEAQMEFFFASVTEEAKKAGAMLRGTPSGNTDPDG